MGRDGVGDGVLLGRSGGVEVNAEEGSGGNKPRTKWMSLMPDNGRGNELDMCKVEECNR